MGQKNSKGKKPLPQASKEEIEELTKQRNEIPCIFFAWLVYDPVLYNGLQGTLYSDEKGHHLLKGYGEWRIDYEFYKNTKTEILHAVIAVCDSRKEVIVAFRGTQSTFTDPTQRMTTVNDWLLGCFDAHLVPWKEQHKISGNVHHGFLKHYRSIEKQIPLKLKEYAERGYRVTFTGHSQGGALATYAALEVSEICKVIRKSLLLITFGAPKCGNQKFREYFKAFVPPERVFRYISSYPAKIPIYDAVTRVPPPVMGFKQVYGQKRYVLVHTDNFGSTAVDFGNVTKVLPLSFTIHFKEVYFKGITSNHVCFKPFTSACAKHFIEEVQMREKEFKYAMCTTYRNIHGMDETSCECLKPEEMSES